MTASHEETTTQPTTITVELAMWGTFDQLQHSIRARLFGEMVIRAVPIIEHYPSDLYHDVHWIDEHVNGETTFYYAPRTYGSHIGEDGALIRSLLVDDHFVCYRVDISCDRHDDNGVASGKWRATFAPEATR